MRKKEDITDIQPEEDEKIVFVYNDNFDVMCTSSILSIIAIIVSIVAILIR